MGLVGPVTSINCSQLISELLTHHCIYINDSNNILRNKIDDDDSLLRCTPSFTIIGTMKSGTGELMNWLNLHPLMQSGKGVDGRREVHFFGSPNFDKSTCPLLDYICHFSISNKVLANAKAVQLELNTFHEEASSFALRFDLEVKSKPSNDLSIFTFDKSPNYIRESIALTQIAKTVPNAKLLVLLRDPADRAYSEFRHHCLRGRYRRLTESVTILSCPKLSMHSFTISEFNGLVHEGERSHKTRRNHSSSDSVLHFLSGSVVNKEILECYVAKGNPVDLSTEVPIPVEELARLLGPLSRRCSYIDFASYYFGPNHIIASISIENKPIMRGWAWEEYTHGLYFEQIQQVLQWYVLI